MGEITDLKVDYDGIGGSYFSNPEQYKMNCSIKANDILLNEYKDYLKVLRERMKLKKPAG